MLVIPIVSGLDLVRNLPCDRSAAGQVKPGGSLDRTDYLRPCHRAPIHHERLLKRPGRGAFSLDDMHRDVFAFFHLQNAGPIDQRHEDKFFSYPLCLGALVAEIFCHQMQKIILNALIAFR